MALIAELDVPAPEKWTDTGVAVAAGDQLRFEASGEWIDWNIPSGPAGFERRILLPFAPFRRVSTASWFALIGCVGRDLSKAFVIGERHARTFGESGALYVFPNDVPWAYGNNRGSIHLKIERI